jgi:SAM-dependent methyltransferase
MAVYLKYDGLLDQIRRRYFKLVLEKFASKPNARLLDYGCGPGDMLLECQTRGIECVGIDNSERSVEFAKERGLSVLLGDIDSLPPDIGLFDVIFLQSVIEHVPNPIELVEKLKVRLKDDGVLILSAPTPSCHFWDDPTHIRPYTAKSFYTLGQICGLESQTISYVFSFLMGFEIRNPLFYMVMNLSPFVVGSNMIAVYKKQLCSTRGQTAASSAQSSEQKRYASGAS